MYALSEKFDSKIKKKLISFSYLWSNIVLFCFCLGEAIVKYDTKSIKK
jgi:hypothetical protein